MLTTSGPSNNDVYTQTSTLATSRMKSPNTSREESNSGVINAISHKPYHTRETCWKIHGKPTNWKPKNQRKGSQFDYVVESEAGKPTNLTLSAD